MNEAIKQAKGPNAYVSNLDSLKKSALMYLSRKELKYFVVLLDLHSEFNSKN